MADEVTITIKGRAYPFPSFDTLTYKEARFIKRETSLVMGQFFDALEKGDPDALLAIAMIARERDGDPFKPEELEEMLLVDIAIVAPEEPEPSLPERTEGDPLASTPPGSEQETVEPPGSTESGPSPT